MRNPSSILQRLIAGLVAFCLIGTACSTLSVYPHSLAYFNELSGGPQNGHRHLLGSNIEWSQDYLYLKDWINEHADVDTVYLHGATLYQPADIGVKCLTTTDES